MRYLYPRYSELAAALWSAPHSTPGACRGRSPATILTHALLTCRRSQPLARMRQPRKGSQPQPAPWLRHAAAGRPRPFAALNLTKSPASGSLITRSWRPLRPADLPKQAPPWCSGLISLPAVVRVNGRVRNSDPSGRAASHGERDKKNQQSFHRPLGVSTALDMDQRNAVPAQQLQLTCFSHELAKRDVSAITPRKG
jgi:hypothetical protein